MRVSTPLLDGPGSPTDADLFRQVQAGCRDSMGRLMARHDGLVQAMVQEIISVPRMRIVNDSAVALVGAVGRAYGLVIVCGTGSIAYGINARGQARRAGGWDYLLGDEGSGYDIGRRALQAVMQAYDGRGQPTSLLPMLVTHLNLTNIESLPTLIYLQDFQRHQIAALVPMVEQAAAEGDQVAQNILCYAADELALAARAVIHGLEMQDESFEVALVGGVFKNTGSLREEVSSRLSQIAPHAQVILPRHEPVAGAALLALELAREA